MGAAGYPYPGRREEQKQPSRVESFVLFFRAYMNLASVVVAALPIPVTTLGLIPTYSAQTYLLSTYTSLFCFLVLGFVFYGRHQLARYLFESGFSSFKDRVWWHILAWLPLLLTAVCFLLVILYHNTLDDSLQILQSAPPAERVAHGDDALLLLTPLRDIPRRWALLLIYVGMFVSAEAAFVIMAMKEYLQDLLGLSDQALIDLDRGPAPGSGEKDAD
jgi:nitrate/nitrite transporter NarK